MTATICSFVGEAHDVDTAVDVAARKANDFLGTYNMRVEDLYNVSAQTVFAKGGSQDTWYHVITVTFQNRKGEVPTHE